MSVQVPIKELPSESPGSAFQTWIRFILGLSGSFYVLMTGSLILHEVMGHGLAYVLCGSGGMTVAVTPGFAGWATGTDPVASGHSLITYAGIAVNLTVGLVVLGLLRLHPPRLTPGGLLLFWLGTTELGHALGYTLQGLAFSQGDAAGLPAALGPAGRVAAMVVLALLFLVLARWALTGAAGFVRDHFRSASLGTFRRNFILGFTLPMAALILWAPGLPRRDLWTIVAFDGAVLAVLLLVTAWSVRRRPPDRNPVGVPISGRWALAWTTAALGTFAATYFWLSRGVTVTFTSP